MARILVSTLTAKRFIGLSGDPKPTPGVTGPDGTTPTTADVPANSELYVADTGQTWIFDGTDWRIKGDGGLSSSGPSAVPVSVETLRTLQEIRDTMRLVQTELTAIRLAVQETYNDGNPYQEDFYALANTVIDRSDFEEPL